MHANKIAVIHTSAALYDGYLYQTQQLASLSALLLPENTGPAHPDETMTYSILPIKYFFLSLFSLLAAKDHNRASAFVPWSFML